MAISILRILDGLLGPIRGYLSTTQSTLIRNCTANLLPLRGDRSSYSDSDKLNGQNVPRELGQIMPSSSNFAKANIQLG
jgi:hypothetical protein